MRRASCVGVLPRCSLGGPNTRTRSSYLHGGAPFHAAATSFGLDTPLSLRDLRNERFELSLLKYVPSRARTRGVPRYFQPTSATQSVSLYLPAPVLSSLERATGSHRALREPRRFTPTSLLGRDHSLSDRVFACCWRGDLRHLTSPLAIPLHALRPLSRTDVGLNRLCPFYERAVTLAFACWARDAFGRSRIERRFLAEGVSAIADATRLETRSAQRLRPRADQRFPFAFAGSRSFLRCARGAPTKLAPAHATRVTAKVTFSCGALWGPKPEHPTSAVRCSTHGHTRSSPRSSSARGSRLCPRCSPATRLTPRLRQVPVRHDRTSEEPCLLRFSPATDLSVVALAKPHLQSSRRLLGADAARQTDPGKTGARRD